MRVKEVNTGTTHMHSNNYPRVCGVSSISCASGVVCDKHTETPQTPVLFLSRVF